MFNLISQAAAQEAAHAVAAPQQPVWASFLPFAIIMVIFYFLMIRPQKKKMDEEKKLIESLKKGDEVYTKSGLIGTIYGMTDKVVTLEIAENVKMRVLKGQVAGLASQIFSQKEANR